MALGLGGYTLAENGLMLVAPAVQAGIALLTASAYVMSVSCLIGFWSVPAMERTLEGRLKNAIWSRILLWAGCVCSIAGFAGLAISVILHLMIGRR